LRKKNSAEIITIGNEILIGHTLDTNSNWIAKRLTEHGWLLRRTTTIPDSLKEIAAAVRESLGRKPRLLFTLGGLGPTPDDMTLKGVARALGTPVEVNRTALEMVGRFYERMRGQTKITGPRRKMAMLPRGAKPLNNPVGTAPGVMLKKGSTTIISLPGVPREMEAIFRESVIPLLEKSGGRAPVETTLMIDGIVESAFAPVIARVRRLFPGLYFKSHPRGSETTGRMLIELHIYSLTENGRERLGEAASYILKELSKLAVD
jgi:molybdenum cofactor synthesis domain-containing protein